MLISITEICRMGCSHCMDDAKPYGTSMTRRIFEDSISFFNQFGGIECIITGGEPTEHPEFWSFVEYAALMTHGSTGSGFAHVTVTTNGMNLVGNRDAYDHIEKLYMVFGDKVAFQVTSVPKYYPTIIDYNDDIFKLPNVVLCTEIEAMYPMGRAVENNIPWKSKCSKCFNIRSAVRNCKDLSQACTFLALHGKFCTPQISVYGEIKLGESVLCPTVSSIYKPTEQIIQDICDFRCNGCSIINNTLPKEYLKAIGEN